MSKIEAGKMKLSPEEENIEDIIENVEVLVRPQTMAKRQEFDVITKNLVDLMGGNISVRGHKSDPKICSPNGTEDTNRGYDSQCLCGGYS